MKRISPPLFALLCLLGFAGTLAAAADLRRGEIEGAPYAVAVPAGETRGVLLFAHGYRPEEAPLSAELAWDEPPFADWLADGWVLASTAYRRNGWILEDAITDLENLRRWLAEELGAERPLYLIGESMGGTIGTAIAEDAEISSAYAGILGVSAALYPELPGAEVSWEHAPKVPLLLVANRNEMAPLERYWEATAPDYRGFLALWVVDRDGHVNLNPEEWETSLQALMAWAGGEVIDQRYDVTIAPPAFSSLATIEAGVATAPVVTVDAVFGNLDLGLNRDDFAALGIAVGDPFTISAGERSFTGTRGVTYSDVLRGEWLAVELPSGQMRVVINYGHAADALGVSAGDTVRIEAAD